MYCAMGFQLNMIYILFLLELYLSGCCGSTKTEDNCLGDKIDNKYYYQGTQRKTRTGNDCQCWDSTFPHVPDQDVLDLGIDTLASMEDFCRTPTDSHTVPWCYTMDNTTSWEECGIATCHDGFIPTDNCLDTFTLGSYNYRGTQSVTQNGMTCRSWLSGRASSILSSNEQDALSSIGNLCRAQGILRIPWCLHAKGWQECGIPRCKDGSLPKDSIETRLCVGPKVNEVFYYSGTQSVTVIGEKCIRWLDTLPHKPHDSILRLSLDSLKSMKNYCHMSNSHLLAWCYVMDENKMIEQMCNIDKCIKENCLGEKIDNKYYYQGRQNKTKTGNDCQRWDANFPHVPDQDVLELGIDKLEYMEDFCRTPTDSHTVPWCYTMDNTTRWEECGIATCHDGSIPTDNCLSPNNDTTYFYQGTQHVTRTGKHCQRWDSLSANETNSYFSNFDNDTLSSMKDYCRTPLTSLIPWCFTTNYTSAWEECGIARCDDGTIPTKLCLAAPTLTGSSTTTTLSPTTLSLSTSKSIKESVISRSEQSNKMRSSSVIPKMCVGGDRSIGKPQAVSLSGNNCLPWTDLSDEVIDEYTMLGEQIKASKKVPDFKYGRDDLLKAFGNACMTNPKNAVLGCFIDVDYWEECIESNEADCVYNDVGIY